MRKASNFAATLGLLLAVFAVGGVHTATAAACAALMLAAAVSAVGSARDGQKVLVSGLGIVACAATVLAAVQLVPVPPFVHQLANPTGFDLYRAGLAVAGLGDAQWRPLSMDPTATADRLLRYSALAAAAVWAANVRGRHAWIRFATWFVPGALAALAVGTAVFLNGGKSFLGYAPEVGFRGPSVFVSTNHGAVFYGLAALVAGAAALGSRREAPRKAMLFGVSTVVFGVGALVLDSDGVFVAGFAAALCAALVWWARHRQALAAGLELRIGVALIGAIALIAVFWLDLHVLLARFAERVFLSGEHGGRLELLRAGSAEVVDYWRLGAGAGAVQATLPHYVNWSALLPASIPLIENDTLELALSFGVPAAALMIIVLGYQVAQTAAPAIDPRRRPRYAVALVSALYVAIVAQLHFPTFALGIALPTVVWFELLWSRRTQSISERSFMPSGHLAVSPRAAVAACLMLGMTALIGAAAHYGPYAEAELDSTDALHREIRLRPGSHVPFVKLATAAARAGDHATALRLADHAVECEPSPRVRLYRARVLALSDEAAAAAAYAELFATGHTAGQFLAAFVDGVHDVEQRAAVIEPLPEIWTPVAERVLRVEGAEPASSLVVELATRRPGDVEVYRLAARMYLAMKQPVLAELWARLAAEAEEAGKGVGESTAPLLLARALSASGRRAEARRVLDAATDDPTVVREAHRFALELRGTPETTDADFVKRHYDQYCVSPIAERDQRICWLTEAWLEESSGALDDAERTLIRVRRRFSDVTPLADFYLRTGSCDALASLALTVEPGPGRDKLELLAKGCAPR